MIYLESFIQWKVFSLNASIFQEKKNTYTKLVPEKVHINFTLKYTWDHLYLFIICIIYLKSSTKVFSTTLASY